MRELGFLSKAELDEAAETAEAWVRQVHTAAANDEDLSQDELDWFGFLASTALQIRSFLRKVNDSGRLSPDESQHPEVFLRFSLFNELLTLMHRLDYSWVSALDEYGDPVYWDSRTAVASEAFVPPPVRFETALPAVRDCVDELLAAFVRPATPMEMGDVLHRTFVCTCIALAATQLELRRLQPRQNPFRD